MFEFVLAPSPKGQLHCRFCVGPDAHLVYLGQQAVAEGQGTGDEAHCEGRCELDEIYFSRH